MQDILSDLSTPTLVRVIKENWMDYYYYLGRAPNAELHAGNHWPSTNPLQIKERDAALLVDGGRRAIWDSTSAFFKHLVWVITCIVGLDFETSAN